jgi:hypothetical protein
VEKKAMREAAERNADEPDMFDFEDEDVIVEEAVDVAPKNNNVDVFGKVYNGESIKRNTNKEPLPSQVKYKVSGKSSANSAPAFGINERAKRKGDGSQTCANMERLRDSLHQKEKLKQAIILSEVLNRKY